MILNYSVKHIPITLPSDDRIGVCCLTGGPVEISPTLFLEVFAFICGTMMSAPGKSRDCRRRLP